MRGILREKKLENGKVSLYIDYYPPVWNPMKKIYTRREFLKLHLQANPKTFIEKKQNELNKELAEKIYIKRMKALMLDENEIFNKDFLEGDFYAYAENFMRSKARDGKDVAHHISAIKYLKRFTGDHCKFRHIDEFFYSDLKNFCSPQIHLDQNDLHLKQIQLLLTLINFFLL